jgi:hypothetical protein
MYVTDDMSTLVDEMKKAHAEEGVEGAPEPEQSKPAA